MRPDQKAKLELLEERLADQIISDIDPENWPGHGKTLAEMEKETRGDALWARKVAAQGLLVYQKVQLLMVNPDAAAGKVGATEADVDSITREAEREADKLLSKARKKSKGTPDARSAKH